MLNGRSGGRRVRGEARRDLHEAVSRGAKMFPAHQNWENEDVAMRARPGDALAQ